MTYFSDPINFLNNVLNPVLNHKGKKISVLVLIMFLSFFLSDIMFGCGMRSCWVHDFYSQYEI